jgi:hypothetical protein
LLAALFRAQANGPYAKGQGEENNTDEREMTRPGEVHLRCSFLK